MRHPLLQHGCATWRPWFLGGQCVFPRSTPSWRHTGFRGPTWHAVAGRKLSFAGFGQSHPSQQKALASPLLPWDASGFPISPITFVPWTGHLSPSCRACGHLWLARGCAKEKSETALPVRTWDVTEGRSPRAGVTSQSQVAEVRLALQLSPAEWQGGLAAGC